MGGRNKRPVVLSAHSGSGTIKEHLNHNRYGSLELRMPHCMMILACIVCVITTIVNVTALNSLISVARLESLPTKTSLEYPDPYVGLENAHLHDPSLLPPIYNFPRVLALINISDPSSVYLDLHHWASGFGMIYPNDRQFLVSSQARLSNSDMYSIDADNIF